MRAWLWLYPRAWRERYGEEMAEVLARQRWSPSLALDLVAGALDARLNRGLVESGTKGEKPMFAKAVRLSCAGYGPQVTPRDRWMSIAAALGVTIAVTLLWLWLRGQYPQNEYVKSLSFMAYSMAYPATLPFTSLKGRSLRTRLVLVGGLLLFQAAVWLLVGFILTARH